MTQLIVMRCSQPSRHVIHLHPKYSPQRPVLKHLHIIHSKGFWRWCVTLITTKLLDFVHRPDFYKQKKKRFGNWTCFRLQARGGHLLYRKTKSLPFHRRCQNKRRSTTGKKGTISTWQQEESMGCNKRIRSEYWGRERTEKNNKVNGGNNY
jgi:hypothetical protein